MRSGIRLVASTTRPGQAIRRSARRGTPITTCSTLSSTSSRLVFRRVPINAIRTGFLPETDRLSAVAIEGRTSSGSRNGARFTNQTPSGNRPSDPVTRCPAAIAKRVFPTPPGPVIVTSRTLGRPNMATTSATSRSRPTKEVSGVGRWPPCCVPVASWRTCARSRVDVRRRTALHV
jgi:hypothetical protein